MIVAGHIIGTIFLGEQLHRYRVEGALYLAPPESLPDRKRAIPGKAVCNADLIRELDKLWAAWSARRRGERSA
jgi:hypothetical protein